MNARLFAMAPMLAVMMTGLLGATTPGVDVTATVTALRSSHGQLLACLTALPAAFPDCERDRNARARKVPASGTVTLDFGQVPAGRYAIAIVHDENGNGRMDRKLMLPTEGYGFSNDAAVVFGPPSFASAAFVVTNTPAHETIHMRYLFERASR